MKEEVRVAASCVIRLLQLTSSAALTADDLAALESALNSVLAEQLADHWHVDEPLRGHGYRCLRVNMFNRCDPVLVEAARRASVRFDAIALPDELTIWIDPNDVTMRIGEDKSFSWSVYTLRNGKCESLLDSIDFVEVLQRAEELRECDPKWIVFRQSAVRANARGAPGRGDRKDSMNVRTGDSAASVNNRDVNATLNSAYMSNAALYNQHVVGQGQYGYPSSANYYYDPSYYYYYGYEEYGASSMNNYSAAPAQPYFVPSQKHGAGRNANVTNGNPNGSGATYSEHGSAVQHRSRTSASSGYSKLSGSPLPNGVMMGRSSVPLNGFHRATPLGGGRDSPVKSPARFTALLSSATKSTLVAPVGQATPATSGDELSQNQSTASTVDPLF